MELIRRAFSNASAYGTTPMLPTSIAESARNLLYAAINFVARRLRICLRWGGSQICRLIATLWRALGIKDLLLFFQTITLRFLKWCGIALATVTGAILIGHIGYWGLPKLWVIYTQRRQRKLEEKRWNNGRIQQEKIREERRAREATVAEALRKSNAARQAREEQDRPRRKEEERRKARTDYLEWEQERDVAFRDKASMTSLPFPPVSRCTAPGCPAFAKNPPLACRHNVKQFLQGSGKFSLAFLRRERLNWHEDRFVSCREDVRLDFQRRANSYFVVLQSLYEEMEE